MRRDAQLLALVIAALAGIALLGASSASATVLCKTATNPCTETYAKGTTIEASFTSGKNSILHNNVTTIECEAAIKGEVTNAGGEATTVSGIVTAFTFSSCSAPHTITVLKNGAFSISYTSGGNGTLKLEGFETEVFIHSWGGSCIYSGTASFSLNGGGMASITSGSITLTRSGGTLGIRCGSTGTWTANYTVTAPEPLYVEKEAVPPPSAVLCKTATNPCTGGTYAKGTMIEAATKAHSILHNAFTTVECEATIKGEVTNPGGEGSVVSGTVTALTLSGCTGGNTVTVLQKGTFSISYTSGSNGTLTLEGFETSVLNHAFGGTCIYSGTASLTLKGGAPASIATSSTTLARTGGSLGIFCGSTGPWTAEYAVTVPEPLYVEGT